MTLRREMLLYGLRKIAATAVVVAAVGQFFLAPCLGFAAQTVEVSYEPDGAVPLLEAKQEARKQAFVQACLHEAANLLPQRLDPRREEVLKQYLSPKTDLLVQGYTDLDFREDNGVVVLHTKVHINVPELKRMLKDLGIFYTAGKSLPYTLQTSGFSVQDLETVLNLQLLTGLDPRSNAERRLLLERLGDTHWRARLEEAGATWVIESLTLETAWKNVWGQYFSGESAQATLSRRLKLHVDGFTSTQGVRVFATMLSGWYRVLDEARLHSVSLLPETIRADWDIVALDQEGLRQRVAAFVKERGLTYSLRTENASATTMPLDRPLGVVQP